MRAPSCLDCIHYHPDSESRVANGTCAAFPEGIPDLIASAVILHETPYPGDHGIQFEPNERRRASMQEEEARSKRFQAMREQLGALARTVADQPVEVLQRVFDRQTEEWQVPRADARKYRISGELISLYNMQDDTG